MDTTQTRRHNSTYVLNSGHQGFGLVMSYIQLFILANNQEETPSIVQIPRNISRKELHELIPLQWVTGYEKLRENTKPLSTSQVTFKRSVDGLVTTTFKKPDEASSSNSSEVFHSLMIKPKVKEDSRMPIFVVKADGSVIHSDKVNGHLIWDVAPENWHTDNTRAHNHLLKKIDEKIDKICTQLSIQQRLEASEEFDETRTKSDESKEQSEESSTEVEKSYSDEEEEVGYMDISNTLMARSTEEPFYDSPVEEEPMISKGSSSKPNAGHADPYKVIEEFFCRMTGTLKEWYHNLQSRSSVLGTLHQEFIGERKIRQEFFEMRCCSLKIKDLDRHFQRMNQKSYLLNGLNDPRHFAKNYPKKSQKAIRLISYLQIGEYDDIESLYSEQNELDDETEFSLNQTDSSDEESPASPIPIFSIQEEQSIRPAIPPPCVEIQVLAKKFEKPIKVIAFIDTGAQRRMMDPDILPQEYWKNEVAYFVAADGKVFITDLVTHAIKFFPDCIIWTKVIGSKLTDRDLLIGMDVYTVGNKLQIHSTGIKFKREFKPFL
ncbi:hypothetical protein JHK82_033859 [Glycine max]|uniref:Retropepsins domain-containing protein n=1 Tax=Glycine max TaxID=3847 RepID=A0A0R0H5C8_SOYBN|nr:hypothetical protein JHK85_034575 [Glycine max]KAG5119439.1 hypothetical protein JHK82_033859 [Glycine max]KAG5140431.1 hypothetical protein JHK84_034199 [Glycine max]KAH1143238.1 hypothetical protein GYH30_033774 [Glycine max]